MKMLGLIGGLSWESTALYYRLINTQVRDTLGGLHSAPLLMYSFDLDEIATLQKTGAWDEAGAKLAQAARVLKEGGAQALVLCTNTMHCRAADIEAVGLPLLHIGDATGEAVRAAGLSRVALLGTRFTMEQDFYRERLKTRFGIDCMVPDEAGRELVHRVIFEELCQGIIRDASRHAFVQIINRLIAHGAQAVILGCTEITLLLPPEAGHPWPVFDTTALHAAQAARFAMGQAALYDAA
ncbi:MAG: aspartate/glutamate racemase family protein [Proteobacteria bacterium]|nr:aspartate/glutamate racemase family protein [Pseudomonadota bacterium]